MASSSHKVNGKTGLGNVGASNVNKDNRSSGVEALASQAGRILLESRNWQRASLLDDRAGEDLGDDISCSKYAVILQWTLVNFPEAEPVVRWRGYLAAGLRTNSVVFMVSPRRKLVVSSKLSLVAKQSLSQGEVSHGCECWASSNTAQRPRLPFHMCLAS